MTTERTTVPAVIVHGGAGRTARDGPRLEAYRAGLVAAVAAAHARLAAGASALDAVEAAVRSMEASGAFNAGRGSCLTSARTIECDAAVMVGETGAAGGCGSVRGLLHPVTLARRVMERTDHVLLVGPGAEAFARVEGIEENHDGPTAERLAEYEQVLAEVRGTARGDRLARLTASLRHGAEVGSGGDTVGAVAVDARGRLAAAVSTGGLWLKLPGRVGDSAILGAGLFADDAAGAAVATGIGEAIIRAGLTRAAVDGMRLGLSAGAASARAVGAMTTRLGKDTAGLIAIDRLGRLGFAMNTEAMGRAGQRADEARPWVAIDAADPPSGDGCGAEAR